MAVLAGLVLMETGTIRPGWLTIFLLGLGSPAILRANFNPLQTAVGPGEKDINRMDRLIDNVHRFVFGEIDRSLRERRNERREKVLDLYTADELEKQIDLRLPDWKRDYGSAISELRGNPAQLAAHIITILDREEPNAIDELAAAAKNRRRDAGSGSISEGR